MKEYGFRNQPLGPDLEEANAIAKKLNDEWDEIRRQKGTADEIFSVERGTFQWLTEKYQEDETWYKDKSPMTKDDIDRAFKRINEEIGQQFVAAFRKRHARALYNKLLEKYTVSAAEKAHKWFVNLMWYATEIGVRDDNPAQKMKIKKTEDRKIVWKESEVKDVIQWCLKGGKDKFGNPIQPRPSIALAVAIAYDTSLPQGDILRLMKNQWDGTAFTVAQQKQRSGNALYLPVSEFTRDMINNLPQDQLFIIVSEETGRPYLDDPKGNSRSQRKIFGRIFARYKKRAGVEGKHFHDIRRTALTELGNRGATEAEIVSMSGHTMGSRVIKTYVRPDKTAAENATAKRWKKSEE